MTTNLQWYHPWNKTCSWGMLNLSSFAQNNEVIHHDWIYEKKYQQPGRTGKEPVTASPCPIYNSYYGYWWGHWLGQASIAMLHLLLSLYTSLELGGPWKEESSPTLLGVIPLQIILSTESDSRGHVKPLMTISFYSPYPNNADLLPPNMGRLLDKMFDRLGWTRLKTPAHIRRWFHS